MSVVGFRLYSICIYSYAPSLTDLTDLTDDDSGESDRALSGDGHLHQLHEDDFSSI